VVVVPGRLVLAALVLALATPACAHPLAPALLDLHERGDGRIDVGWKTPLLRPRGSTPEPALPARCRTVEPERVSQDGVGVWTRWAVDCGAGGLVGEQVGITGADSAGVGALVRVTLKDGRVVEGVVSPARPLLSVPARPRVLDVVGDYGRLGIEHLLAGPDHLLLVFGLVLLAAGTQRLLLTIAAFTVGHSVTLALATLGVVDWPPRPLAAAIAATVLLLAVELARRPAAPTFLRRRPWTIAAAFGLLHGLAFAGVLHEAGLPAEEVPLALLSFNAGIEVGQLAFVAAMVGAAALVRALPAPVPAWARWAPVYVMGSVAASWWIERTMATLW